MNGALERHLDREMGDRESRKNVAAPTSALPVRMTPNEITLLSSFLRCTFYYLEFGAGGSTTLAAELVKHRVWTVDSSVEWLRKVEDASDQLSQKISCHHVDIGPVGLWGYPLDGSFKSRFADYYTTIWDELDPGNLNFVLVDGRFRVASFCQSALRVRRDTFIGFHDYKSRADYHCVEGVARIVAQVDDLAIFVPKESQADGARRLIEKFAYNPL